MILNRFAIFVLLMGCAFFAKGQGDVRVHGYFETDSAAVGEVLPYVLTASYPSDKQVLFPDSTFTFLPFEYSAKKYFPTRTINTTSYDSVVYFLSTFEIDSIQRLSLPVFVVYEMDCVAVFSATDSLRLQFRVKQSIDSISVEKLPLKISTVYQKVKWIFNYPILIIGLVILVILLVAGWMIFGKRIRRYLALRRLRKNYETFLSRFGKALEQLSAESSIGMAEGALVLWKKYMEDLEEFPYTKSTSREILRKVSNANLGAALRSIDRGIYGGYGSNVEPFTFLRSYSQEQFQKRQSELENG
jgi:hypothetical protein